MKHFWKMAVLAAALGAAPALAEPARSQPVAARQIINAADAGDLFTPLPGDRGARARHAASGLICAFGADGGRILVFPGLPRGDDVGCDAASPAGAATLYATRYPMTTDIEAHLDGAIRSIHARYPAAQPYAASARAAEDGSRSARFVNEAADGARLYTRVSLALIDGWVIKMRYSAPAADDAAVAAADAAADQLWADTLATIAAAHST